MPNDDLEINIAAGLDLPTALAVTDKQRRPNRGLLALFIAVIIYWLTTLI